MAIQRRAGSVITVVRHRRRPDQSAGERRPDNFHRPLRVPVLPVKVSIDNQPADVLYAGAAPGLVQGVIQINVRVPAGGLQWTGSSGAAGGQLYQPEYCKRDREITPDQGHEPTPRKTASPDMIVNR